MRWLGQGAEEDNLRVTEWEFTYVAHAGISRSVKWAQ